MKWLLALFFFAAVGAQAASLSGKVRDQQGTPIPGAQVAARSEKSPLPFSTTTDTQGAYHLLSLPAGEYQLETSLTGFATSQSGPISLAAADVTLDVTLTVNTAKAPAAHPQFEAAGVRGLIDPGGYSAPANAAAATGLIKGIADIQRTDNRPADNPSCALEPGLKKAQAANPESGPANLKLGEFYLGHGQAAKAIPLLERARSANPADAETIEHLAEAYLHDGQFDAAGRLLKPEMHRLRARVDEGTGKFTEAAHEYQLAADRDRSEEDLYGVGYESILAGSPVDAQRAFQAGIERFPRSVQLLIGLGSAQFLQGHTADALRTLLQAVDLNPADPRPYPFLSAATGTAHDQPERVRAAFERFHSLAPDDPHASYYLALELLRADDPRVESLLKRAIVLDPGLADAHYQLGVLYARQGNPAAAAQELEAALRLSPNLKEAHYRLAAAYRQTGRKELSAQEMQRFREEQELSAGKKTGMGTDIDQFISVFAAPASAGGPAGLCPGDSP